MDALQRLSPGTHLVKSDLLNLVPLPGNENLAVQQGLLVPGATFLTEALPGPALPQLGERGALATRVITGLGWDDLVLPAATLAQLEDIGLWLSHSHRLLDDWGMAKRIGRGHVALFFGPPGTGKTLSACLLGQRCGLEVHRIDLSMVVSKYIGETEKNLSRLFDTAQRRKGGSCSSTKPMPCSANAPVSATPTTATPTRR